MNNGKTEAVVIMDQASWHQRHLADEFHNLTIIHIPPYSPELNPIEQVWHWLRQNEQSNRCFSGYEDIVNSCSDAWDQFREDKSGIGWIWKVNQWNWYNYY